MSTAQTTEKPSITKFKMLDKSGDRVRQMFAEIAPRYDLMNHVLSLNIDTHWRAKTLRILKLKAGAPVLDACTGTGDLAISMARSLGKGTAIVGSDFCSEMLQIAREKRARKLPEHQVEFLLPTERGPHDRRGAQLRLLAFARHRVGASLRGEHARHHLDGRSEDQAAAGNGLSVGRQGTRQSAVGKAGDFHAQDAGSRLGLFC